MKNLTKNQKFYKKHMESMMDSLYTYGGVVHKDDDYLKDYLKHLGKDIFDEVFETKLKDLIENYHVRTNVFTDRDGLSYNSLVKK